MPRVEQTVDISASPETVWFFLSDPTYTPKLVPDMISNEAEPAGPAVEGQKTRGILKVAGRKMKVFTRLRR